MTLGSDVTVKNTPVSANFSTLGAMIHHPALHGLKRITWSEFARNHLASRPRPPKGRSMARAKQWIAVAKPSGRASPSAVAFVGRNSAYQPGGPRRSGDRADGSGMSRVGILDDPEAKSSITGRAPTNIWPVGVHLEMAEQTQRTCAASSDARSRPRSTLYYPTAHPGVSVATPDRPTGLHLIRIIQGSILGLLGVPARRRDDVGSQPTAAGGLTMYRP